MQMYTASQLRQIHEERIAPFIQGKGNNSSKPKKKERKISNWAINLFKLI